jgi:hypothetical protein
MPFIGLGLHVLLALFFAVHAVRNGKQLYWIVILFMFPLLGSIVYFFAEFLPSTQIERQVAKAGDALSRAVDPGRDLREARQAFEVSPTAQSQQQLALALLNAGDAQQAASHFAECLAGPFGTEPDLRLGAARTHLELGRFADAIALLRAVRADNPAYRPQDVTVLLAQAYWADGNMAAAAATYAEATRIYGDFDIRAEHVLFALETGDIATARSLQRDIDIGMKTWTRHSRKLNKPMLARLDAAWSKSGQSRG